MHFGRNAYDEYEDESDENSRGEHQNMVSVAVCLDNERLVSAVARCSGVQFGDFSDNKSGGSVGGICRVNPMVMVVDDLLRWEHEHGRVEDSVGWQLAVGHLRVTLHLSIVLQLLKPLGCNYRDHYHAPSAPSAPSAPPPEAEAPRPRL